MPAREINPLTALQPWPGFDPSFSGHSDRRAIISEWTRLRLKPLSHRGWLVQHVKIIHQQTNLKLLWNKYDLVQIHACQAFLPHLMATLFQKNNIVTFFSFDQSWFCCVLHQFKEVMPSALRKTFLNMTQELGILFAWKRHAKRQLKILPEWSHHKPDVYWFEAANTLNKIMYITYKHCTYKHWQNFCNTNYQIKFRIPSLLEQDCILYI